MPNIWVGGDWHLWNANLRDERHPFRSKQNIEEFKQYLASKPIQPDDVFLVLGDLCDPEVTDIQNLRDVIAAIPPCMRVLVKGNHDTAEDSLYLNAGFDLVTDIALIHHMVFSHIPVYVSHEQLNVHAHLHSVKISVFDERYVNVKNVDPCILLDDLLDRAMRQNKSEYEGVDNDRAIQNYFKNNVFMQQEDAGNMKILDLSYLVPQYPVDEAAVLNEYIFDCPDEARMWLADDDTPPKADEGPAGEEKDNHKYTQTNYNTMQESTSNGLRAEAEESVNLNDGQSSKAVELTFYLGNNKVGTASVSGYDTGAGFLYDLEVVKRYRGKGYSKDILEYVMKNYSVTDISVEDSNKVAINLYEKFGFKLKKVFDSNGENGYDKGRYRWYQLDESVDDSDAEYLDHPEVKDDNFNGEQVKFFQDQQTYKESLPDESAEVGDIPDYKFSLEEEIVFNDDDLLDEAVSENSKLYPVYVVLIHSGTLVSNAIKKVSKAEFSHASISFDSTLKRMYSFARKDPKNPFAGGFRYESIGEGFYTKEKMDKTPFAIYLVPCTKYQIEKMKKRLKYFIENESKFTFDFIGLFKNYFGIVANPKMKWFCSRFVADILNAGANNKKKYIKEPSLMDPEDFKKTDFARFVCGGMLGSYNQKETDQITKGILKSEVLLRKQGKRFTYHTFGEAATYSDKIQWYKNAVRNESVEEYERSTKELRICFTPDMRMKLDKENYEVFYAVYRHLLTSFIDCGEYDVETRMELYGKLQSLVKFFQQYFFPSVTDPATNEFASVYTRLHAEMLRGLSVCRKKLDTTVIPESVTYFQSGRTIPYLTETVYVVPY